MVAQHAYTCDQDLGGLWLEGHDCMLARITTQLPGAVRPPTCVPEGGHLLLTSASTPWAGLPFEVHRMDVAEDVDWIAPPAGEHGMLIVLDGSAELVLKDGVSEARVLAQRGTAVFSS